MRNNKRYQDPVFNQELKNRSIEVMSSPGVGQQGLDVPSHWATTNVYSSQSRQKYWNLIKSNGLSSNGLESGDTAKVYWSWPQPQRPDEPVPSELFLVFTERQHPGTLRD